LADSVYPGKFAIRRPGLTDLSGYNIPLQYLGIQFGDINADGRAELIALGSAPPVGTYNGYAEPQPGPVSANVFDPIYGQWNALPDGPVLQSLGLAPQTCFHIAAVAGVPSPRTLFLADIDADGRDELLVVYENGLAVYGFDHGSEAWAPLPNAALPNGPTIPTGANYLTLDFADIDGDGQAELAVLVNNGEQATIAFQHCTASNYAWTPMTPITLPNTTNWTFPIPNAPADVYYSSIRFGMLEGQMHVFVRASDGVYIYSYSKGSQSWSNLSAPNGPLLSDASGWNQPQYYRTFQLADIDGDGDVEIIIRGAAGIYVYFYDPADGTWSPGAGQQNGPALSDSGDWNLPEYYSTIQCADIDNDGQAELLARGTNGIFVFKYDKTSQTWSPDTSAGPNGPALSDSLGWNNPAYYLTIHCADIDGSGSAALMARYADGVYTWKYNSAASAWAGASAVFPAFTGNQAAAYTAISEQIAGPSQPDLRKLYYTDINYSWLQPQETLSQLAASGANGPDWQVVATQLLAEVDAVIAVMPLFNNLQTAYQNQAITKTDILLAVGGQISSTYSDPASQQQVDYSVLNLFGNIVWALSTFVENPAFGVISGLIESAVAEATSFPANAPANPVTAPFNQMCTDLADAFNSMLGANNNNLEAVLSDYGLLMTIGGWLRQAAWPVGPPDQTAALMMAERAYAFYVFQALGPTVWCVFQDAADNLDSLPCNYDLSWVITGPGNTVPWPKYPIVPTPAYYVHSLKVYSEENAFPCIDTSVLQNLFGPVDATNTNYLPLAVPASDVLTGKNGWTVPLFLY